VVSSLLSKESIFFHCQEQGKVLDGEPGKWLLVQQGSSVLVEAMS
jgi:hypothetical protein